MSAQLSILKAAEILPLYIRRRVKVWPATRVPSKEVFFAQQHHPGRLSASDFAHMTDLTVTIQNQTFPHLPYHFVVTYSKRETGMVCFSESFESVCEGFQNTIWECSRVANGSAFLIFLQPLKEGATTESQLNQVFAIRHFFVTFHPNHSQTFVDNSFTSKLRARRVQQHHTLV